MMKGQLSASSASDCDPMPQRHSTPVKSRLAYWHVSTGINLFDKLCSDPSSLISSHSSSMPQQQPQAKKQQQKNRKQQMNSAAYVGSRKHKRDHNAAATATATESNALFSSGSPSHEATKRLKEHPASSEMEQQQQQQNNSDDSSNNNNNGWRVKLYRLNSEGSWDDCGTGRIYRIEHGSIMVVSETTHHNEAPQVLLRTRILVADAYQRQGDNIITWCEPVPHGNNNNGNGSNTNHNHAPQEESNGVDLALSFQDNEGCSTIWKQLTGSNPNMEDLASAQATEILLQRLPRPVTLENLQCTADKISIFCTRQREGLALYVSGSNCAYLRELLSLLGPAERDHLYSKLATLAACVKSLLLMNDPCIIDTTAQDADLFYNVCACLEYDPDLREKSNHRWFLQQRARFRTVVPMTDLDLVEAIHRSFRVQYLKDTLLRPTMDEGSLSSLQSLQTFCHAEVIKGVTAGPTSLEDSYLVQVLHLLSVEVYSLQWLEWTNAEHFREASTEPTTSENQADSFEVLHNNPSVSWKQHLIAQDESVPARKERRKGCILFLKELFNMVRVSLQPCEKDDFVAVVGTLLLELTDEAAEEKLTLDGDESSPSKPVEQSEKIPFPSTTNLLSILATLLLERNDDITKSAALEILTAIAVHDPGVLRQHCLEATTLDKPTTTAKRAVLCLAPCDNVVAALLILNLTQSDAGILLQINEILRAILDTDLDQQQENNTVAVQSQRDFLEVFYDHYAHWIVAPFLHQSMRYPIITIPERIWKNHDALYDRMIKNFQQSTTDPILRTAGYSAIRMSFSVEILRFCVRTHLFDMKSFLLKSRVLSNVMSLLRPARGASGDRCLKLAVLRLLRTLISVNDEFYNRHIIQNNLFGPVFEAFRANPVGDNLVSSAIMEICDFIQMNNIRSLMEYIVTKHLSTTEAGCLSLEDIASPYVSTLTTLRERHETNANEMDQKQSGNADGSVSAVANPPQLRGIALDDQRKFMQSDQDDSYFMDDTEDSPERTNLRQSDTSTELGIHGETSATIDNEIHRTPTMFYLASDPDEPNGKG